ncbi:MAG: DNA cytosine methyltransferase [Phycisphaeraceae bacterium]|nr:DNA cytosine methyltransferase [Phycisphaeraceae bacterium]
MTTGQTVHAKALHSGSFVDLFAGCGGLSLGLLSAGWNGLFAVERDPIAFETLNHNLVVGQENCPFRYDWPTWLEKSPIEISHFIESHREDLATIKGKVDLLAGGPPCQGFSLAGRRKRNDPRNELFKHYVELVKALRPSFVLLENVKGISVAFTNGAKNKKRRGRPPQPFSEKIKARLQDAGYSVFTKLVHGTDVGVPQFRPRYIMLAVRNDLLKGHVGFDPFKDFEARRKKFLKAKGLPVDHPVTVKQAISDLVKKDRKLIDCVDSKGFKQIEYSHPLSDYQRLLHGTLNGTAPNSLRLAKHGEVVSDRFETILATCRKGVSLSDTDRKRLGLKKHCIVPLHPDKPSHTLTTLPDDFLHYSEPRILTVREYARLQSFPDWYDFKGKYTTGGNRRLRECPRYTQAGNAVPPLLAEFLGRMTAEIASDLGLAFQPRKDVQGELK